MGSDLLGRFESELANRGIVQIYGHLPNESPEVIDCLTRWYQKRGYQVNVNPKPGEVPNGSKGKISKTIHPSTS
ncbi:MAG: hypothetical protein CFE26_17430 [Verrucomicrobiales bacterium VVV1]|nr:MAG: hypothetical protein CFE26_17430 [Verrucomicrobiales bacterium VVV1]